MILELYSKLENGETLTMVLNDPTPTGLVVIDVKGLGAPKTTVSTMETTVKTRVNSTRTMKRTLVLTVAVLGVNNDVGLARQTLYKFFPSNTKITFGVNSTHRDVVIDAWVEAHDENIFLKTSHAVITLMAPDGYFHAETDGTLVLSGVEPMFEFVFSNESLTEPLLEFGSISRYVNRIINYEGDADTGLIIRFDFNALATGLVLYNETHVDKLEIDTDIITTIMGSPIQFGDTLIIDTRYGSKSAIFIRDGIRTSVINALGMTPTWLRLYPGFNDFVVGAVSGLDAIDVLLTYRILFEGI